MWFKVDDRFPMHRKARHVRRSHPDKKRDVGPLGLWVIAGALSDDGFIAVEVLEEWDDDAIEFAERLVSAGLWERAEQGGEPGYRFHDWEEMNPDPVKSGAFGNHLRWHVKRGKVAPDCMFCSGDDRPDIAPESPPIIPPDIAPDIAPRIGSGIASPTRPDPIDKTPSSTHVDVEFEAWWKLYPRKVDKGHARKTYRTARTKTDAATLLNAVESFAETCRRSGTEPKFIAHAATWLNGERWTDTESPRPRGNLTEWEAGYSTPSNDTGWEES